jgi:hypothetical protein
LAGDEDGGDSGSAKGAGSEVVFSAWSKTGAPTANNGGCKSTSGPGGPAWTAEATTRPSKDKITLTMIFDSNGL